MIAKLRRKRVILIGTISLIVVALVVVFAVPALAAGWPRAGVNKSFTTVQGDITALSSSSITIGSTTLEVSPDTNFTIHGVTWLANGTPSLIGLPAIAVYNNTVTPLMATQVMINMPNPSEGPPGTPNYSSRASNRTFTRIQGTVSAASVTITSASGTAVTLNLAAGSVTATYNSANDDLESLMVNVPRTQGQSFTRIQGTVSLASQWITITPTTGSANAVTLNLAAGRVVAAYNSTGDVLERLMVVPALGASGISPGHFSGWFSGWFGGFMNNGNSGK